MVMPACSDNSVTYFRSDNKTASKLQIASALLNKESKENKS